MTLSLRAKLILARCIAAFATATINGNKGASSYHHAEAAVHHFTQAHSPTQDTIRANANKGVRRSKPSGAKTIRVPDVHSLFSRFAELYADTSPAGIRAPTLATLMMASGRRVSDLVRIWRNPVCLRFEIRTLDTQGWARQFRSEAAILTLATSLEAPPMLWKPNSFAALSESISPRHRRPKVSGTTLGWIFTRIASFSPRVQS